MHSSLEEKAFLKEKKKEQKKIISEPKIKKKYQYSLILNLILGISVAAMFLISATSHHPTILNYEEILINRYSAWEQELTEREAVLRQAETP